MRQRAATKQFGTSASSAHCSLPSTECTVVSEQCFLDNAPWLCSAHCTLFYIVYNRLRFVHTVHIVHTHAHTNTHKHTHANAHTHKHTLYTLISTQFTMHSASYMSCRFPYDQIHLKDWSEKIILAFDNSASFVRKELSVPGTLQGRIFSQGPRRARSHKM